jgi:hypothetical protein
MGKVAQRPVSRPPSQERNRLNRLRGERRKAMLRLQQIDIELAKLQSHRVERPPSPRQLDRWFEDLSDGLSAVPPLPLDFSRADLYADHD